jgi:hypothetical protein
MSARDASSVSNFCGGFLRASLAASRTIQTPRSDLFSMIFQTVRV